MNFLKLAFMALILTSCITSENRSEDIISKLKIEGKSYFEQLVSTNEYENLLDRIEAGDDKLIRNVSVFLPWVDASTSTALNFSLSRALIKNPDAVTNLIPKYFSANDICTIPYIEETIEVELTHINASIKALQNSSSKNTECLSLYKKFKSNIERKIHADQ